MPPRSDIQRSPTQDIWQPGSDMSAWSAAGIEWIWSTPVGDWDNDGHSDQYQVGRQGPRKNAHRDAGGEWYGSVPYWGPGETVAGSRSTALADFDVDGDLHTVVNNLDAPSLLYENRLCRGNAVTVRLSWLGTGNVAALGATVQLASDDGGTLLSTVESSRGYLSGASTALSFGVGNSEDKVKVEITWPDGEVGTSSDLEVGRHYTTTRPGTSPPG